MAFVNGNAVADSDELAALEVPRDILPNARVFNVDVGADFLYTISTAALVPDEVVAVAGCDNARWIVSSLPDGSVVTASIADGAVTSPKITYIDWFDKVRQFVAAKDSTIVTTVIKDDLQTEAPNFVFSEGGSGVTEISTASNGGVAILSPGSTAGGTSRVKNIGSVDTPATPTALVANTRTAHWALATRAKSPLALVGTASHRLCNMSDDSSFSVMVCIDRSFSTTKYAAELGSASNIDTGVTIDTAYHDWIMINDGTNVKVYHNFNTTAVASAAVSNISTNAGHLSLLAMNGDQNTAFTMHVDKIMAMTENP